VYRAQNAPELLLAPAEIAGAVSPGTKRERRPSCRPGDQNFLIATTEGRKISYQTLSPAPVRASKPPSARKAPPRKLQPAAPASGDSLMGSLLTDTDRLTSTAEGEVSTTSDGPTSQLPSSPPVPLTPAQLDAQALGSEPESDASSGDEFDDRPAKKQRIAQEKSPIRGKAAKGKNASKATQGNSVKTTAAANAKAQKVTSAGQLPTA
jgi:hypothetical protein